MTTETTTKTTEQQLKDLAPKLAEANARYTALSDQRKALEKQALEAVRAANSELYIQEAAQKGAYELIHAEAILLLTSYQKETGSTGNILDGWYQITAPLKLQLDSEQRGDLLDWLLDEGGFLRYRWLTLDEKVIESDLKSITDDEGSIKFNLLSRVPAQLTPAYGSKIMWSKLPQVEAEKATS